MIRKQIYLEEALVEQIKKIADKNNISQSELIRQSIKHFINEEQIKGEDEDPLLKLIGLFSSDVTDGSTNHDHYIYGAKKHEK
ncbi:ribbon-helix-helix domain-containing protein [Candidatus Contubernalis alkaliaceticus]|uniref:ribbon-helix-helix domain-containing protein n=1 Tax=Candidatus Contubernalis alkaliaceticus TaxID=338645 RepID=UPI001F4BDC7C|nr:CopG family transcriptional regulator [Candidatus Contubernalis alkalaceticus]UNC92119.1 CopG family transcriptional regulator [Candidatus Contubernalis alkalaceticus]